MRLSPSIPTTWSATSTRWRWRTAAGSRLTPCGGGTRSRRRPSRPRIEPRAVREAGPTRAARCRTSPTARPRTEAGDPAPGRGRQPDPPAPAGTRGLAVGRASARGWPPGSTSDFSSTICIGGPFCAGDAEDLHEAIEGPRPTSPTLAPGGRRRAPRPDRAPGTRSTPWSPSCAGCARKALTELQAELARPLELDGPAAGTGAVRLSDNWTTRPCRESPVVASVAYRQAAGGSMAGRAPRPQGRSVCRGGARHATNGAIRATGRGVDPTSWRATGGGRARVISLRTTRRGVRAVELPSARVDRVVRRVRDEGIHDRRGPPPGS